TLAEPIREGYTFGGWYEDELFTKSVTQISNGSMGDKAFYAKWDKVYSYNVTAETDKQQWVKGSNEPLVIIFKSVYHDEDTFSRFESAKVDDNAITEGKDFEKARGSIIISLKPEYLNTLAEGNHSLQVNFTDGGAAYADFTIVAAPAQDSPNTGDSNAMALLFGIVALSGAGAFVAMKKKQTVK
ncbi:MAG: InlB B-repeat-containing protein, partial [Clostridia bacterium]|nr:InlB B-repeat-containing protein [Clostridia bacterium]